MTAIADTPFAKLDTEGRLLKPILNADTHVAGRFGYRGDISYDGPETVIKEVFSVSESGKPAIGFLAGSIKEYETLPKLVILLGQHLMATASILFISPICRKATGSTSGLVT